MLPFVPRQGGKSKIARKLIRRFPKHSTYIEPFIGGGSVFLLKNPSIREIINDKDIELYTLWKGMQDSAEGLSTFSFKPSKTLFDRLKKSKPRSVLNKMYRTLYVFKNSFGGLGRNYASKNVSGVHLKKNLAKYKERLSGVTIINADWKRVVKRYDSTESFFFLDPPYSDPAKGAKWSYEKFTPDELLPTLKKIKGKFLLTFQKTALNKRLFKQAGFKVGSIKTTYGLQPTRGSVSKTELVVTNY